MSTVYVKRVCTLSLGALLSTIDTTRQSELPVLMPPKYQLLVPPSPISISEAVLRALSLSDLQVPRIPLILIVFVTLIDR